MRLQDIPRGPSLKPALMRAALEGAKTETRRVCKPMQRLDAQDGYHNLDGYLFRWWGDGNIAVHVNDPDAEECGPFIMDMEPAYQPGLYSLREPLREGKTGSMGPPHVALYAADVGMGPAIPDARFNQDAIVREPEDDSLWYWEWKPDKLAGIFMPKRAARAFVELDVRVEHLQEMTVDDMQAEGLEHYWKEDHFLCRACGWVGLCTAHNICESCRQPVDRTPDERDENADNHGTFECAECGCEEYVWTCPECGYPEDEGGPLPWSVLESYEQEHWRYHYYTTLWKRLWNDINPEHPWESDPWVFVYSWSELFTRDDVEDMS